MNEDLRPTRDEIKRLYELAAELKEMAPWRWMQEDDVFGVQNFETGEVGFVSIMGQLAEHQALAVYIGAKGLYGFLELEDDEAELFHKS